MEESKKILGMNRKIFAVCLALVLFFVGFTIAKIAETNGGTVEVTRVDFLTDEGYKMSAKLYVPDNASEATPAPGIVLFPGGNANLENLSGVAIELSRRGYVCMAIDPYTIGRSAVVTKPDVGSRAAMDYFMSLKIVDPNTIGVVGHSAGSGRAGWAATTDPDQKIVREGVKSIFYMAAGNFHLEGINEGLFIGTWDNTYGQGKTSARDALHLELHTKPMGVDVIENGKYYTMADGSQRVFYQSSSGHPTALVLPQPILDVCEFMDKTLASAPAPKNGTIHLWKELGTSLGIIGCFMMLFPVVGAIIEKSKFFGTIVRPIPAPVSGVNKPFLFYLIMPALINVAICKWAIYNGQVFLGNFKSVLRINNLNGFVFWFGCSALLSFAILMIRFKWDKGVDRKRITSHAKISWQNALKCILLGCVAFVTVYAMVYAAEIVWGLSPRIWKFQVNVIAANRWKLFFTYLPLYFLFFGMFAYSQTIGLRISGQSEAAFTRLVWITSAFPTLAFLAFTYGKLWFTGYTAITNVQMSRANSTLLNNILVYFLTCKVITYTYKKTGSWHTGAVINAMMLTWAAVATDLITVI